MIWCTDGLMIVRARNVSYNYSVCQQKGVSTLSSWCFGVAAANSLGTIMDYIKKAIWGPTPEEQMRKCNQILRKNNRALEKQINNLTPIYNKTESLIKKAVKENNMKQTKLYIKELIFIKNERTKLINSKAKLESVSLQINNFFKFNKISKSMVDSTLIMKEINSLVKLPVMQSSMMDLSKELVKSGIISEMMDDTLDLSLSDDLDEMDEVSNDEVNKILASYTKDKFDKIDQLHLPNSIEDKNPSSVELPNESENDLEEDKILDEMRQRLKTLQN